MPLTLRNHAGELVSRQAFEFGKGGSCPSRERLGADERAVREFTLVQPKRAAGCRNPRVQDQIGGHDDARLHLGRPRDIAVPAPEHAVAVAHLARTTR